MSIYCVAHNWGRNFITHEEKEKGRIVGYPGNIWVVSDHMGEWVAKVNGERKTRAEAQTLVSAVVDAGKIVWNNNNVEGESLAQKIHRLSGSGPQDITLP